MTEIPLPTFTFTIPSLYDDTSLECRIYHAQATSEDPESSDPAGNVRGAIIAHPYAPLGGCYDDPLVQCLVEELLEHGLIVGTFNFRGAGASKSRTSWTGKAEVQDYVSFAGLFAHYLHHIQPDSIESFPIDLVLGGYSYGSLITTYLPTPSGMLSHFNQPESGTAAAEILLRAQHFACEWHNRTTNEAKPASRGRTQKSSSTLQPPCSTIIMGGDEYPRARTRHEGRTSLDVSKLRRSIERSSQRLHLGTNSSHTPSPSSPTTPSEIPIVSTQDDKDAVAIPDLRVSYLLVSPILPPLSSMLVMFSSSFAKQDTDKKLVENDTLVVYGDGDVFTSCRKLRRWAEGLKERAGGEKKEKLSSCEVAGAGHFWREPGVEEKLKRAVGGWVQYSAHGGRDVFEK